jgi:hypothetical protein
LSSRLSATRTGPAAQALRTFRFQYTQGPSTPQRTWTSWHFGLLKKGVEQTLLLQFVWLLLCQQEYSCHDHCLRKQCTK